MEEDRVWCTGDDLGRLGRPEGIAITPNNVLRTLLQSMCMHVGKLLWINTSFAILFQREK